MRVGVCNSALIVGVDIFFLHITQFHQNVIRLYAISKSNRKEKAANTYVFIDLRQGEAYIFKWIESSLFEYFVFCLFYSRDRTRFIRLQHLEMLEVHTHPDLKL